MDTGWYINDNYCAIAAQMQQPGSVTATLPPSRDAPERNERQARGKPKEPSLLSYAAVFGNKVSRKTSLPRLVTFVKNVSCGKR